MPCWMWAMSFPKWGDGTVEWEDAEPVYDEQGRLVTVRAVNVEDPDA